MKALELKIPPVIIFLLAIVGIYFSPFSEYMSSLYNGYALILGIALFISGVIVGLVGVITFKRANTTVNPHSIEKASSLVTHGIFKFTRNPMYLGMAFGIIGAGVYRQTELLNTLLFLFFYIAYLTRFQISPEERMLQKIFGQTFADYKNRTRRWL